MPHTVQSSSQPPLPTSLPTHHDDAEVCIVLEVAQDLAHPGPATQQVHQLHLQQGGGGGGGGHPGGMLGTCAPGPAVQQVHQLDCSTRGRGARRKRLGQPMQGAREGRKGGMRGHRADGKKKKNDQQIFDRASASAPSSSVRPSANRQHPPAATRRTSRRILFIARLLIRFIRYCFTMTVFPVAMQVARITTDWLQVGGWGRREGRSVEGAVGGGGLAGQRRACCRPAGSARSLFWDTFSPAAVELLPGPELSHGVVAAQRLQAAGAVSAGGRRVLRARLRRRGHRAVGQRRRRRLDQRRCHADVHLLPAGAGRGGLQRRDAGGRVVSGRLPPARLDHKVGVPARRCARRRDSISTTREGAEKAGGAGSGGAPDSPIVDAAILGGAGLGGPGIAVRPAAATLRLQRLHTLQERHGGARSVF